MKIVKIIGLIVILILGLALLILGASTLYHRRQLKKEAQAYLPSASMIELNGKMIHVHTAGEGDSTLVFLSGHGTSSPALDFKPLWMRMKEDYRIAVVEKSGYGWSEPSNTPRDIDTILEETRTALNLSGEQGPYVLLPHSMSGLEAIYWAQKYPDEVKAIIGLDPLTPVAADILPAPDQSQLNIMYLVSRVGLSRFMPEADLELNFPLLKSEDLTADEKQRYLAVFYKSAFTKDMLREVRYLDTNFAAVAERAVPVDTPMLFFISEGQETHVEGWKSSLLDYLSNIAWGEYRELAGGHYLHYENSELIAEEMFAFLEEVQ